MESYWIKSTEKKEANYQKLEEDITVDVCIIGGGITGITTAYYLNKEGLDVAVIEQDKLASKASGKTTGKITSQHGCIYKHLLDTFGEELARKYLYANQKALKNIEKIILEEKISCDFKKETAYVYTTEYIQLQTLKDEIEALKAIDSTFPCNYLEEIPMQKDILGAVSFNNQAQFHPRKYILSLANIISQKGAKIFENTKALSIKKQGEQYCISTKEGKIKAKNVVVATQYPFKNFPGMYFIKMYQSTSYAILAETSMPLLEGMYISENVQTRSFRTVKDGNKELLLAVGSDHKTGINIDLNSAYTNLEDEIKTIYQDAKIKYKWNTQDCITLDKVPYIGEFSSIMQGIYVATGYNKWGMSTSNIAAEIITDKILNRVNKYEDIFKATRLNVVKNHTPFSNMVKQSFKSLVTEKMKIKEENLQDIKAGDGKVIIKDNKKVGVYKDPKGKIYLVNPVCTHLGCLLVFNNLEKTWDCPCHGSRFTFEGKCIYGPSNKDLESYTSCNKNSI
ncbi:MAG: FAD-dependent oxidoreductase [Clostridia bacterium]